MPRQADDTHVMHPVFPAELCADAFLLANLQHLLFPLQVAESPSPFVAARRQVVVITRRSLLHRSQVRLSRRAANHHCQVVRRAGGCAQVQHLLLQELRQSLLVQEGFRLLVKERLVR